MSGELEPVGADSLAKLESAGWISRTALIIDRPLPVARTEALGALIGTMGSAVRWWAGDFLIYAEQVHGELAAQISESLNMSPEGRLDALRVARAFPRARRKATLSFGHHRALAALWIEPERRYALLDEAERERWTVRELEARVRDLRALEASRHVTDVKAEAECDLGEEARDLHERLLACGFPKDLQVEIRISAPGVSDEVVIEGAS